MPLGGVLPLGLGAFAARRVGFGACIWGLRRVPFVLLGSRRSCSQGGFLVRAAAFDFSQRQIELPADAFGHLLSFRRVPPRIAALVVRFPRVV